MTTQPNGLPKQTEASWQAQVLDALGRFGYATFSVRKSSVVSAKTGKLISLVTDAGWPDVVAFKGNVRVAFELKTDDTRSQPTPEQLEWLEILRKASFVTAVLRPRDLGTLNRWLNGEVDFP